MSKHWLNIVKTLTCLNIDSYSYPSAPVYSSLSHLTITYSKLQANNLEFISETTLSLHHEILLKSIQKRKTSMLRRNLHSRVYCSIVLNSKDREFVSLSRWMDKATVVHVHSGILLSIKGWSPSLCWNLDELGGHYVEWNTKDKYCVISLICGI